jgi:hypothetical protein
MRKNDGTQSKVRESILNKEMTNNKSIKASKVICNI